MQARASVAQAFAPKHFIKNKNEADSTLIDA